MRHTEQWIWLPSDKYTNQPHNIFSALDNDKECEFIVAEFMKEYELPSKVASASLRFSGDCTFQLYCNNKIVATGPACVGGDFIGNETRRENFYAFETEIFPDSTTLNFFARVKMLPSQICEYSKGQGGFMLSAILTFEDGTQREIHTDESWLARKNGSYSDAKAFDKRIAPDEYIYAQIVENVWHTETAPIPIRVENELFCKDSKVTLAPFENKILTLNFDKIWAGFLHIESKLQGEISVTAICKELNEEGSSEHIYLKNNCEYRGFYMHSAGNITIVANNKSDSTAELTVSFIETRYPVYDECETVTSDNDLKFLKYCSHFVLLNHTHCDLLLSEDETYLLDKALVIFHKIEKTSTPMEFINYLIIVLEMVKSCFKTKEYDEMKILFYFIVKSDIGNFQTWLKFIEMMSINEETRETQMFRYLNDISKAILSIDLNTVKEMNNEKEFNALIKKVLDLNKSA